MAEPQQITVHVNLTEQGALEPHEWEAAPLGEDAVLPFATFVRVRDAALLLSLGLVGYSVWAKTHHNPPRQAEVVFIGVVVWIVLNMIRIQDVALPRWVVLWLDHFRVLAMAPGMWGDKTLRGAMNPAHRFTALLPPEVGQAIHANVVIAKTGILDVGFKVAGVPKHVQELASQAFGKERYRQLIELTMMGDISTLSPESLRGIWQQRLALWGDLRMPFSLFVRSRPFPRHVLEVASGPVAREAGDLAGQLVLRRLLMAVYGGSVDILKMRLTELLGIDRDGRLAQAGYGYRVLDSDVDIAPFADDAWGKQRKPALGISPGVFEIHTGQDDPKSLVPGAAVTRPAGVRQWVTFALKKPPSSKMKVGWLSTSMQGRAEWDLGIHAFPEERFMGTNTWLGLKADWYEHAPLAPKDWARKAHLLHRHMELLAERATTTVRVGLYASVPETQADSLKSALDDMLGRDNAFVPILRQQQGRASTEPWGRDTLGVHFTTDSGTLAMMGPPDGSVIVRDGLFFALSMNYPMPLMYDPWFLHDDASVALFIGKSGSGKTNAQQILLASILEPHSEHILAREGPVPVVIIYFKPVDEWEAFVRRFKGIHIHVGGEDGQQFESALEDAAAQIGVAPIVAVNLNDLDDDDQERFTRSLTARIMSYQRHQGDNFRKRFALLIGEMRVLTRTRHGAMELGKLANQARGLRIWLCGDTQFVDHLLNSPADDVRRNAGMVLLFKLDEGERSIVKEKFGLSDAAFSKLVALGQPNTLAGSVPVRGVFIGRIHGVWVYGKVVRLGELARLGDQTNAAIREAPELFTPREHRNGYSKHLDVVGLR